MPSERMTPEKVGVLAGITKALTLSKRPLSPKQVIALVQMRHEVDRIIELQRQGRRLFQQPKQVDWPELSPDENDRVAVGLAELRDQLVQYNAKVGASEYLADAEHTAWLASKREEALTLHWHRVHAEAEADNTAFDRAKAS
jgi:hypothetical protein